MRNFIQSSDLFLELYSLRINDVQRSRIPRKFFVMKQREVGVFTKLSFTSS